VVYFDLKHMDQEEHRRLAGAGNVAIIENCRRLSAHGTPLVVRVPLAPGYNDNDEHLKLLSRFVKALPKYEQVHLLPYHRMGKAKYKALGLDFPLAELEPPTKERVQHAVDLLRQWGIKIQVVC
jgi:pyruvate formate lyase activating enzyme